VELRPRDFLMSACLTFSAAFLGTVLAPFASKWFFIPYDSLSGVCTTGSFFVASTFFDVSEEGMDGPRGRDDDSDDDDSPPDDDDDDLPRRDRKDDMNQEYEDSDDEGDQDFYE
jgi:hypothetical protein